MKRLVIAFLAAFVGHALALEPWADSRLPVTDGLDLWLDAAKVREALPAIGVKQFDLTKRKVEAWPDGSGQGHHARQQNFEFRPVLQTSAGGSAVRFDGRNSFLASEWNAKLDAATVFIVAAPRLNGGGFRALAAMHPPERNDYIAGLNIDLGAKLSTTLDTLNIEGAGASGQNNLLRTRFDLGTFHVFAVEAGIEKINLRVDGKEEGSRPRQPGVMELSEFLIGARWCSNDSTPRRPLGFFDGDIAEVIFYQRALTGDERTLVERYLLEKHSARRAQSIAVATPGAKPLRTVANPAPVQCLMPGFEARELPLQLTNVNFLKYRYDGALFAGAYNGKIWLLRDTDGDGIEDQATLYYESPNIKSVMGLAVAPKGYPRGDGVFVATVGHVYFIPEKDGKGEKEITVASGWPAPQIVTGGVSDCLGVALDREGGVWFGLGTSDFTRPYLPDPKTGAMTYRIPTERGTIQHVSPDFQTRTTVCTGIRFPVGLAFNARGDLFCTDQEGATWLPNGNPLDELLYIQPGRHYGFPPRHPQFLQGVVDEPSVFDFSPQHQSTCGFFFNDTTGPVFGPAWWKGEAFVCGESRGKLWRVMLAKTDAGYVAQTQLFAHLNMLPIDATLSPRGDLVVTCHSGAPDWGSGPNGMGKIFHIRETLPGLPKPVLTWPASATESVITWDRPLTEPQFQEITHTMDVTAGPYTRAGDRYESLRPGYQVVSDQLAVPQIDVPVKSASLSVDHRSIILQTAPRQTGLHYALRLAGFSAERPSPAPAVSTGLPQENTVDLDLTLHGLEASFEPASAREWKGWLPHPDPVVARGLTRASGDHTNLFAALQQGGKLTLRGQLDLYEMLQPAIQPGAKLDYERPPENVSVRVESSTPFTLTSGTTPAHYTPSEGPSYVAEISFNAPGQQWQPFELHVDKPPGDLALTMTWSTGDDSRPRAFPLRRFFVPWAQREARTVIAEEERHIPELDGGNWLRGKNLFYSKATCSICHTINGAGGKVGPDLSNLRFRDYASVLRDIREPSATINPDFAAYLVQMNDGAAFTGVVNGESDGAIKLTDATGQIHHIARGDLKSMQVLPVSLMPEKLLDGLDKDEQRDLLTYLLQPPFEPAPLERPEPPPARKRAEIEALLKTFAVPPASDLKPLHIVLCAGPKDHGAGEHDYPLWQKRWSRLLAMADGVTVSTAWNWPSDEQWSKADVIVFYSDNPSWNAQTAPQLDAFLARGGGAAFFHYSVDGHKDVEILAAQTGLAWRGGYSKFRHGPLDLALQKHPLAQGLPNISLFDESYWNLVGDESGTQLLASGAEENVPRPLMWTREQDKGRVFVSIPGHFTWTFDDPLFRILAFRGICWAAHQPMDRLAPLVTLGARLAE